MWAGGLLGTDGGLCRWQGHPKERGGGAVKLSQSRSREVGSESHFMPKLVGGKKTD